MRIYEVFLKREGKDEFRHAGSLEASDDELAVVLARQVVVELADPLVAVDRPRDLRERVVHRDERPLRHIPWPRRRS